MMSLTCSNTVEARAHEIYGLAYTFHCLQLNFEAANARGSQLSPAVGPFQGLLSQVGQSHDPGKRYIGGPPIVRSLLVRIPLARGFRKST
jgi:hypothetical protein